MVYSRVNLNLQLGTGSSDAAEWERVVGWIHHNFICYVKRSISLCNSFQIAKVYMKHLIFLHYKANS